MPSHRKLTSDLGSPAPCFRYEDETGGDRNLVIFEDKPFNNHAINEKVSSRALH